MKRLVCASNNQNKIREIRQILSGKYDEILSLKDVGADIHTVEDGKTFEENAVKKAREAMELLGCEVLADDSGICVDALGGAPGVYSARFSGEDADDLKNNELLKQKLADVPENERGAEYVCCMALARPGGEIITAFGRMRGMIILNERGTGGFGYDPLFYLPEYGLTAAELAPEQKNAISHRAKALENLLKLI